MTYSLSPVNFEYEKRGVKLSPFAGFNLPIQFSNLIDEHLTVRQDVGIFDVSHMGEIEVIGEEAATFLQYVTCNDISKLSDGKAHYSALLNEIGGVIDDIIVYRFTADKYLLCVNASNIAVDFSWLLEQSSSYNVKVVNRSSEYGQLAIQGPKSLAVLETYLLKHKVNLELESLPYFSFSEVEVSGIPFILAMTGYTGEVGCEIFLPSDKTSSLWSELVDEFGIKPCGLGCRDTLRLEASYPLHGHELLPEIPAISSGLEWIIKFKKGDFIGKEALLKLKEERFHRRLIGFKVSGEGIVRHGSKILSNDSKEIGFTTSGTKTPTLDFPIGMAIVDQGFASLDTKFHAIVREREVPIEVVALPFYSKLRK
jgi:aminomethyltransferase